MCVAERSKGQYIFILGTHIAKINAKITARGQCMNGLKLAAIVLIIAGVLGLAFGGFTYTKKTEQVKLGPIALTIKN